MHTHRYIARFKLEADTPLFLGSGQASLLKDAMVQKDSNGMPMINGTTLAGVLRHSLEKNDWIDRIFGFAEGDKGTGSQLKVSSAYMILENGIVSEGLLEDGQIRNELYNRFENLPSRQHVRITHRGVAADKGLFDNEVVYKGVCFVFELELRGTKEDVDAWQFVVNQVKSPNFRLGSGTRNGYGFLKVISMYERVYNLQDKNDFDAYIEFNPSFNKGIEYVNVESLNVANENFVAYKLELEPDSFFVFSEGFGDDEADNRPLEEEVVIYTDGKIEFQQQTVIPATSIKGAIAHRVAFHYNKLKKQFADNGEGSTGVENTAVSQLFGQAGQNNSGKAIDAKAGNVFINDFYYCKNQIDNSKILNHVAIDRFTGGAMDGALFSEKVSRLKSGGFNFKIFVTKSALESDSDVKTALENTLIDICKGLLPLGGMTTKGHGIFTGSLISEGQELFNYSK
jgi:CRISPR/Cas system CSM-associated protein Csm3 (group 7 of RAMP superfamily)